jgi:integrase
MALTDRGIKNFKAADKDVFHSDGRKLYLRVYRNGSKIFVYRDQSSGSSRWVSLGTYPELGLADARQKVLVLAGKLSSDKVTVQTAYDEWIVRVIEGKYKSPRQVRDRMELHFTPKYGTRLLAQITRAELANCLGKVAATAPVQANRLLTDIKLLFNYAVTRGWLEASPAQLLNQTVAGGREISKDRVLSNDELLELLGVLRTNWSATRKKVTGFDLRTRLALGLALLTGQRSGEIRSFTRAHFKGGVWRIPKQITKTAVDMQVHLGPVARRLCKLLLKEFGSEPFVVDGVPMAGQALSHATRYMKFEVPFTPHDLRRTMRTHMSDLGVMPHIGEKCLNHKLGGVLQIYDRGEYVVEKRAAWRAWERHLLKLVSAEKRAPPTEGGPIREL